MLLVLLFFTKIDAGAVAATATAEIYHPQTECIKLNFRIAEAFH